MSYPKFEKIDDKTIMIIDESRQRVDIQKLIKAQKELQIQRGEIDKRLKHVETILQNAKEFGIDITPKVEEKKDVKN